VDTIWSDVSEWQCPVNDSYPYPVLAIRSNDGTYRDKDFTSNHAWARSALDAGRLKALLIYLVYRPNWSDELNTLESEVGSPHPRCAVMIDVESWGGQIRGDQSAGINNLYQGIGGWLGDCRRVIGYGNVGDLNGLWPHKPPGIRLIIAAYGSNPDYPGKLGHQFTDGQTADHLFVPPFGFADVNSADGYDVDAFCAAIGLAGGDPVVPGPLPPPPPPGAGPGSIPDMAFGQQNPQIAHLQSWCNAMFPAYSHLPVTGFYGPETTAVIAEFQRRMGITSGDGRNIGPRTKTALWGLGYRP
jgi:peptidoglycan hydrolase-like protein with peptidoglycan-binding domain